jgi:site-specific DNA-methyltransferase (adenine-specific)
MSKIELHHGDCLKVMKSIPDNSIDAIITDPPYGTTACKWDSVIPFELMWKELKRIIKPNGAIVLFGSQPFTSALIMSNIKMFKYEWIWNKKKAANFANVKKQPLKIHEQIIIFNNCNYFPTMEIGKLRKKGGYFTKHEISTTSGVDEKINNLYYPKSIVEFTKANNKNAKLHPTQKPLELLEYLIKTYTQENETVLDFTMGSGTTGVACKNINRNFIGIELDNNYFEIAKERIESHEPQMGKGG